MLTSVRHKLLLLVLFPLGVSLPILIGLVVYWGSASYDRLLILKVNADLIIAQQYLERVLEGNRREVVGFAGSARLLDRLGERNVMKAVLEMEAKEDQFDFVHLLSATGRLVATSSAKPPGDRHEHWPVVARALEGKPGAALDVYSAEELGELSGALRQKAYLDVVPTADASRGEKKHEPRGMIVHAAAPVFDRDHGLLGVVETGVLLNRNLDFVDKINDIVYSEGSLPLGSKGTVTLFLDDMRIATNVRMFADAATGRTRDATSAIGELPHEHADDATHAGPSTDGWPGERALGTRVSLSVRDKVLGEGQTSLDREYIVNQWYVSSYHPLHDSFGRRIGMLSVGYLEAPFAAVKSNVLFSFVALFVLISLGAGLLGLHRARAIFRPIERMDLTMHALERGDGRARVGAVSGQDEITRLAEHFDRLLDTLAARRAELEQLNAELDRKVIERTRELQNANEVLRSTQAQLLRSERLAAVGQVTAGVAHELNNPIAVMQGNLDLMREVLGENAVPIRTELKLLDEQVERVRVIVGKLLQFAAPDQYAGYVEQVDVNAVVADCLLLIRHELKKAHVVVRQGLSVTRKVRINPNELQQVLINLMVNALQAMPQGGTLTLETADCESGGTRISVSDTGCGIAAENLQRVFDAFFTTKKGGGTGLGLPVSLSLVERYGGTITVESEPGRGSTFHLWLLDEPKFAAAAEPALPAQTDQTV